MKWPVGLVKASAEKFSSIKLKNSIQDNERELVSI